MNLIFHEGKLTLPFNVLGTFRNLESRFQPLKALGLLQEWLTTLRERFKQVYLYVSLLQKLLMFSRYSWQMMIVIKSNK